MMLIGDGVTPGNEGRGYVLRRLLRRAVRSMRLLGTEDRVLPELLPVSRDKMGETYPELHRDWERHLARSPTPRRTRSGRRCGPAPQIFDLAAAEVKQSRRPTLLSGDQAFALHDTYGFPIDLTLEMAAEQGLEVDEVGFRALMTEQRAAGQGRRGGQEGRPRRHHGATAQVADALGRPVDFTGYDEVVSEGAVRGIVRRRRGGAVGAARATRSSWCSTARRSTPRAAASWPTRASSSSTTARGSRSSTCSRRSPA